MVLGPAGETIVAVVEDAARFQIAAYKFHNFFLVLMADPGPHPMHADTVQHGHVRFVHQFCKAQVIQFCVCARSFTQQVGVQRVGWVEIGADKASLCGCRMNVYRNTLPEAQLTVHIVPVRRRYLVAVDQQAETLPDRTQFPVVAVGVGSLRKVTVRPHKKCPLFIVLS